MSAAITTVTRRLWRHAYDTTWIDVTQTSNHVRTAGIMSINDTCRQVALMDIGPQVDYETMVANIELGNDGVAMHNGRIEHYFERDGVLPVSLWADCEFHLVLALAIIWDRRHDNGMPPL